MGVHANGRLLSLAAYAIAFTIAAMNMFLLYQVLG